MGEGCFGCAEPSEDPRALFLSIGEKTISFRAPSSLTFGFGTPSAGTTSRVHAVAGSADHGRQRGNWRDRRRRVRPVNVEEILEHFDAEELGPVVLVKPSALSRRSQPMALVDDD